MAGLGVLGSLAQGYADEARLDRQRQFERAESQRGQQLALTKILLESPQVPAEYKPQLAQFGLDTIQAKGGKLPSFDKFQASLPAITQQQQTQSPAIEMPPAPFTIPAQGEAPAISGMNEGATIPATPQTVRGNITRPGEFHMLTPQEMAMQEAQAQNTVFQQQIAGMRAQGFSDEQIANKLGMSKFAPIPFGGLYNTGTGEVITPTQSPVHQGRPVPVDKAISPTGWAVQNIDRSGRPTGDWLPAAPPTGYAPTDRSSTTSDEFGFKTATKSHTERVLPSVASGAGAGQITAPAAPQLGADSGTGSAGTKAKKPATPAAKSAPSPTVASSAQFTGTPAEKRAQYDAWKDSLKLSGTTKTMVETAPKVSDLSKRVRSLVEAQRASLGPSASRWNEFWTGRVGTANPEFAKLRTDVGLLQTLLMRMHVGARGGRDIMAHFSDLINSGKQSPENMLAALDEIDSYANEVAQAKSVGQIQRPQAPANGTGGASVVDALAAKYGGKKQE